MDIFRNFLITDQAGPYVAGRRNTGVGTRLSLTEKQAEAGLRDGHLVPEPTADEAAEIDRQEAEAAEAEAAAAAAEREAAAKKGDKGQSKTGKPD